MPTSRPTPPPIIRSSAGARSKRHPSEAAGDLVQRWQLPTTAYFRDGSSTIAIEAVENREQLARILQGRTSDGFVLSLIWILIEHVQARDEILSSLGMETEE